jgi:DNA invertase Pin-like site-specific DNA recombinase
MRAVGYVRISKADRDKTDEQQRLSIRTQRGAIARACEEKGWDLLDIYEDFAASGANDDRVDFCKVQERIDSKGADVVVVQRVDRLSRKAWRLLWLAEEKGWNIYSIEQSFDTSEPEGWFVMAQHSVLADYERRLLGKRTKQALAQLRREGKHTGRPSLIPVELEDRIFELHSHGMSASAIAELLEAEGAPRPTPRSKSWHHSHVLAAVRRVEVRSMVS